MPEAGVRPLTAADRCGRALATFGGVGLLRPAPGTWGSIAAAVLAFAWLSLGPAEWLQPGMLIAALAAILLGWVGGRVALASYDEADPGQVVIDEVAGVWCGLALFPGHLLAHEPLLLCVVVLLLFRVFDIAKPWPVGALERLPGITGVMADDIAAGLLAGLLAFTFVT